jgi:hypothetical protein
MEIAALMRQFPFKYPKDKYSSTHKRFKVILNELYEMGVVAAIKSKRVRRGSYKYQVEMDFKVKRTYNSSQAAKARLFREYIKLRDNGQKEKGTTNKGS